MIKINGKVIIERDYVGEIPTSFDATRFRRACNVFFAKRGMLTLNGHDLNHADFEAWKKRKKRRGSATASVATFGASPKAPITK